METQVDGMTGASEATTQTAEAAPPAPQTAQPTEVSPSVETQGQAAESVYQPSYKFKVLDKEHEFDEIIRPLVKTKDHEAKIRELYEKAYGLDHVKAERENVRNEYKSFKSQWEPIQKEITEANKFYQMSLKKAKDGDQIGAYHNFQNFVNHLGLDKKLIQQFVFQELQMEDLPQQQKMEYTRRQELETQALGATEEVSQLRQEIQEIRVRERMSDLNSAISKPEIAPLVQAFDQRKGPGAFKNEVIRRGQMHYFSEKKDMPAEDLVKELVDFIGYQAQPQAMPQAATIAPNNQVPVIPVVKGGGNSSPTHKNAQTIEDLRKTYEQKFNG
jgi:hypothetical protein